MGQFSTIDSYINSFEGKTKERLIEFRELIVETVPEVEELINYNIAAFNLVKGGKRDQQLMIAGYKNHVGFSPHPTTMDHFWDKLNAYKKAKGSVQFPLDKPLPKVLIKEMILYRLELIKQTTA